MGEDPHCPAGEVVAILFDGWGSRTGIILRAGRLNLGELAGPSAPLTPEGGHTLAAI